MVENFLIAGNDRKMTECKNRLNQKGFISNCSHGNDFISLLPMYKYIILPLPTVANGFVSGTSRTVKELNEVLSDDQIVFFGNLPLYSFGEKGHSYYNDEAFLIENSRLTAQGVLKIILENIQIDLKTLNVAVLGFGRCGKAVCSLLKNCGFCVTSFSRRRYPKTLAENDGYKVADIGDIDACISCFDIIVNTIPNNIISEKGLEKLNEKNLYIEIASKPYGFDISNTDVYNFKYVLGESLPGKFTPVSAGMNIADTVLEILKEG